MVKDRKVFGGGGFALCVEKCFLGSVSPRATCRKAQFATSNCGSYSLIGTNFVTKYKWF